MRRGLSRLAVALGAAAAIAWAVPAGASAVELQQVGPAYASPMFVTSDPSNPNRLFVVEREGRVKLTVGGTTTTFLDIHTLVDTAGERGLLSMAFAPDYAESGRFYVDYADSSGTLHIDQFTASGNTTSPSTRRTVLTIPHPGASNHNGGQLQFGPDGHLYISTGDGGTDGDNAQDVNNLLGKILRIDPKPGGGYTSPSGNPFVGITGADAIWSLGLRNPWRFSFDRSTGALVIGDVGEGSWEEVDYRPQSGGGGRGNNFGWNCREGLHPGPAACSGSFTNPIFEYSHDESRCAITGGYVVRDPGIPDLAGRYLYVDLCVGDIRSLVPSVSGATGDRSEGLPGVGSPSSFGEDSCGRVYVMSLDTGVVSRFVGGSPTDCSVPTDQDPPALDLGGKDKQRLRSRRIKLKFTSDESATLDIEGKVTAASGKRRLFGLRTKHRQLQSAVKTKVTWKLSKRQARRCRHRIRNGRRVKARFTFTAADASGNTTPSGTRSVRLTRR